MVVTRTPLRISFAGGGTDMAGFYEREMGAVLSATIDQYVYVTVKRHGPLFNEAYRLNYAETELAHSLDEIRNEIARECLRLVPVEPPLYISTVADIPSSTGLGSSSSFAVGLLNALHALQSENVGAAQLMEEAAHVEIVALGHPIGKQDQGAAAHGGCNCIRFKPDGGVTIEHHSLSPDRVETLFGGLQLFWTGITRGSADILGEQKQNIDSRMDHLRKMRDQAVTLSQAMLGETFDMVAFGQVLDQGWRLKRELASTISNPQIDTWYDAGKKAGAIGGKLCGAGGGGFLMFVTPLDKQNAVKAALAPLQPLAVKYEHRGSQIFTTG